tara:strand:+ start:1067 stop:1663 length:597 start_codon:yes stop_codon:yes gene_type:complete
MLKIPTYCDGLNRKLGGGLYGLFEIFGDEGVGKTGVCMSLFKSVSGLYVDMDGTFPHQLNHLLDESKISLINGYAIDINPHDLVEMAETVCSSGIGLMIVDPVGVWDDWTIADLCKKLHPLCIQHSTTIGLINHCHANGNPKGNISSSTYCHTRIEMRSSPEKIPGGMVTEYEIKKNIHGPTMVKGSLVIDFEEVQYG